MNNLINLLSKYNGCFVNCVMAGVWTPTQERPTQVGRLSHGRD